MTLTDNQQEPIFFFFRPKWILVFLISAPPYSNLSNMKWLWCRSHHYLNAESTCLAPNVTLHILLILTWTDGIAQTRKALALNSTHTRTHARTHACTHTHTPLTTPYSILLHPFSLPWFPSIELLTKVSLVHFLLTRTHTHARTHAHTPPC